MLHPTFILTAGTQEPSYSHLREAQSGFCSRTMFFETFGTAADSQLLLCVRHPEVKPTKDPSKYRALNYREASVQ